MFEAADYLRLARDRMAGDADAIEALEIELTELSQAYARRDGDKRLLPAEGCPGYLQTKCGAWQVFVPWPLAAVFPGTGPLAALLDLGACVGVPPVRSLCISGSCAAMGAGISFGDLDFCQYVAVPPAELVDSAACFTVPEPARVLVAARYGRDPASRAPWMQSWQSLRERMRSCTTIAGAERFIIEFLGFSPVFGVVPVSNVVLASDWADRRSGASAKSYVFQEAVAMPAEATAEIGAGNGPYWPLLDCEQLIDYMGFLRGEIAAYAEQMPIKALKRMVSLASTIKLQDYVTQGLEILVSPPVAVAVQHGRHAEVMEKLSQCGPAEREVLAPHLGPVADLAVMPQAADIAAAMEKARTLARGFLGRLNELERRPGAVS